MPRETVYDGVDNTHCDDHQTCPAGQGKEVEGTFKKTENTKCESCTILAGLLKNAYSHSDSHAGCYSIEDHNKDRIQISSGGKGVTLEVAIYGNAKL